MRLILFFFSVFAWAEDTRQEQELRVCVCVCFKELERNLELSANSFQRQLAAEKRRTLSAQEEIQSLQEELQRVTNRLKVRK